ncbi:MAG: PTS sugar transporter subunit IIA [Planctomycetota bacterium]|jgi:mannitol/fructose-specific phosphotransferase system IIA component (Ntr-type)|nr:PTS sugar transporter subunit IIA [Planctomycetota bacterium]
MSLSDYIQPDSVFLNLDAADKDSLLDALLDALRKTPAFASQPPEIRETICPMVKWREGYGSTAVGNGILFPHARVPGVNGIILLLATCRAPIHSIQTPDGQPVFMACLAVLPAERPSLGIKLISTLSRLFAKEEARTALRNAASPQDVANYIDRHDSQLESVILVRDLILPYEWTAAPDTPVRDIARHLLQNRVPGVAVLDKEGKLLGEVTLTRLERFGLPNFFLNLKSVSFVRQFDPFEQYFLKEAESVAADIMNGDAAHLDEDGTLMEAIHALAVNRRALVHVCRDGVAVGYVDSVAVLNRVLSP